MDGKSRSAAGGVPHSRISGLFAGHWRSNRRLKSEAKSMVRRLIAWAKGRIANSPLQVGAQTCTRVLPFGENFGICARRGRRKISPLQVRATITRRMRPNAMFLAIGLVTSLTLTT